MGAIFEENPAVIVIAAKDENIENFSSKVSHSKLLTVVDVHPSGDSITGNAWEQTKIPLKTTFPNDIPDVPPHFKVLKIDGEDALMSNQWMYRDSQGKFLCYIQRFDNGTGRKEFRPLTLVNTKEGTKWTRKAPSEPRPLYGLDRLAANPDAEVMICEGEKATDAAEHLFPYMVAICSMNGAHSPEKTDWSMLAGRTVLLWGDFDQPGEHYIATVEKLATKAGAHVIHAIRAEWFLEIGTNLGIVRDTLPTGWDAADAIQEGFTAENIQLLLDQDQNEKKENFLFGQTPNQAIASASEFPPPGNNKQIREVDVKEKRTRARELFKDSEFAVIEFCKEFKNGVYWQEPFGDEDIPKTPLFLCTPLIVVAQTRDNDQSNWGRLLSWQDNDGYAHKWDMSCRNAGCDRYR